MFGEHLKIIRKQAGLSQKSLASLLQVSQQSVWKWEMNESSPNPETVAKIAKIFHVSSDYLLGLTEQEEKPTPENGDRLNKEQQELVSLFELAAPALRSAALAVLKSAEGQDKAPGGASQPLSFVIAGSGWRAMFYVRVALRYPQCFKLCYLLCRTQEKAEYIHRKYGIPVTTEARVCMEARPDFVVVAVDRASNFAVTKQWLEQGYAVLAETPAAETVDALEELWALSQRGARLQIAEQYIRYPLIAAGLRAIERGLLGDPCAVELSLAHDYHAASLIRHMLRCGLDTAGRPFPAVKLWGKTYDFPVEETGSRYGSITDGSVKQRKRVRLTLEFDNGKAAFYDFDSVQYHSEIRARRINVQGQHGEWNDTILRYTDASHHPVREELKAWLDPSYEVLHTRQLLELSRTWNPEVHMESLQDEYAIATLMLDMRAFIDHNREGYPLSEALEDAYTWLLMDEAARHPGQVISSRPRAWHQLSIS